MGPDKKKETKKLNAEELEKRSAPFTVSYKEGTTEGTSTSGADTTGGDDSTMSGSGSGKRANITKKW